MTCSGPRIVDEHADGPRIVVSLTEAAAASPPRETEHARSVFDSARVIVHVIAVVIVKALSQDMGMVSMQMLTTMTDVDNSVHDDCDDYDDERYEIDDDVTGFVTGP